MPIAAQRDHDADHGQPKEQKVRKLVSPKQRTVEQIARDDAGEQDSDLSQHEYRANRLTGEAYTQVQHERAAAQARPQRRVRVNDRRAEIRRAEVHVVSGPTYFSSSDQALSPAVFFMSG